MSNHGEIASVLSRVAWMMDHGDADGFADCWCDDGTLHHSTVDGHVTTARGTEIRRMFEAASADPDYQRYRSLHIVNNPDIEIDGDRARARYYVTHTLMGPQARPVGVEECDTRLRRCEDGLWRIEALEEMQLLDYTKIEN